MSCGFRLKKDLPFAKAGETIDEIRSSRGTNELSSIRIGNCTCDVSDNENIFDWIEEVKPREWWVAKNPYSNVIGYGNVNRAVVKDWAEQQGTTVEYEIIKVTEIL